MATTMIMNLNLLSDSSSSLVDPTMQSYLIRSSIYVVNTRLDICFAVNTLIQYMVEPRRVHLVATKNVLRYLHGMVGYGLGYVLDSEVKLQGYTKSNWEGSIVDQKRISGYFFSLGLGMIS
jgi:hypothetical protein